MKEVPKEVVDPAISYVSIKTRFQQLQAFSDVKRTLKSLSGNAADISVTAPGRSGHGSSSNVPFLDFSAADSPGGGCGELETPRRILCVWDVDDTLVTSGAPGIRQCSVFSEEELTGLFRGLKAARHLLLSQGSIDDVFAPGGLGKLAYLEPFFREQTEKMRSKNAKVNIGCGNFFSFCAQPSAVRQTKCNNGFDKNSSGGKKKKKGGIEESNKDIDAGGAIVRIATLRAPPERPEDTSLFLSEDHEPPRCSSEVRWLVMRPSLWGITLASLSNFIIPSAHTAFLDGSVFHKMDVVRSLAASGIWDVVFFMDNDLTELGVVRPGLGIEDYYRMKGVRKLSRFFHADLLLLEVSAALEEKRRNNSLLEMRKSTSRDGIQILNGNSTRARNGSTEREFNTTQTSLLPIVQVLATDNNINDEGRGSVDSTSSLKNQQNKQPQERVVELVLAHFRLSGTRFRRITKAVSDPLLRNEREWWHPAFRMGHACTDEEYTQLMEDFFNCEAEVLNEVTKPSPQFMIFSGWEPSADVVCYPIYKRPKYIPNLKLHYIDVCHQVTTNIIDQLNSRLTTVQECELRREANILYRRLIRRQPVIDPQVILKLATTLFETLRSERRLPRNLSDTLKKDIQLLLGDERVTNNNSNGSERVHGHNSPIAS